MEREVVVTRNARRGWKGTHRGKMSLVGEEGGLVERDLR